MGSASDVSFLRRTMKNSASGTVAGIAICLVGHPFDTLKVRLQTQPVHNPVYKGLTDCFLKTIKWEGPGGLYKGVGSPLVGQMFFRATFFTSYYQITTFLGERRGLSSGERLRKYEYFIAGMVTGGIISFVEGPIDLFKTKMQIQIIRQKSGAEVQYRNVFHAGYVISKTYGIRGALQGVGGTLLRNIPANAMYFGNYELFRTLLTPEGGTLQDLEFRSQVFAGGIAGLLYWSTTYPTDVIKSTMQSDDSKVANRKYRNIYHCATTLYKDEGGWTRFYRGFTPCLMRSIPANAVMLTVLEYCRKLFQ
eukprot:GHVU01081320.1.p1 GENE.GHVU01081320.1~~GHVU01081320.1.p1  ORF type:complete len:307 (+),score=12.32 GHVU01081320.1:391-1311(+)